MAATSPPRWSSGLSWNFAALAFAAVAGLAANVLIAREFGPSGLGVFSQTLTLFSLAAQVAAIGVHYAVLQKAATAHDRAGAKEAVNAGATVVAVIATGVALLIYFLAPLVGQVLDSEPLVAAVRWAAPALVFHALAKVVAAGLNGSRRMTAFSGVLAARAGGMLAAVVALGAIDGTTAGDLGLIFVVSEAGALAVGLMSWGAIRPMVAMSRELVSFGVRASIAALTVEVNSKIDIAVLGLVASDEVVGVYALAATAFEGVLQVFVVLRNQMNPLLSAAIGNREPALVDDLQRKLRVWTRIGAAVILIIVVFLTGAVVDLLGISPQFLDARIPLVLLLSGLVMAAPLLPFDQLLVVTGEPGAQSRLVLASLFVNLALNIALVPMFGGVGAAIGTASAIVTLALGVVFYGNRMLGTHLYMLTGRVRTGS